MEIGDVFIVLFVLLVSGVAGGWIAKQLRQPIILGELTAGALLENIGIRKICQEKIYTCDHYLGTSHNLTNYHVSAQGMTVSQKVTIQVQGSQFTVQG
ncbi:MAG: hypothetical protein J7L53_06550 [Deltaproteobacteria bacterium]|nr:hypothetical protein [Deltaproteobacteria bacterium]